MFTHLIAKPRLPISPSTWFFFAPLLLAILACNALFPGSEDTSLWVPENPTEYTAEVQYVWDLYVATDAAGNVIPWSDPASEDAPLGVNATMRYQLQFWDVGKRVPGKETAVIYAIYQPYEVFNVADSYTPAEAESLFGRTDFPVTMIDQQYNLTFTGGPEGRFGGTNPETGESIFGHLEWNEEESAMYAIFDIGISLNFLVIADEAFYNWP